MEYVYLDRDRIREGKKSPVGTRNRKTIKITVLPETYSKLTELVEFGKGKYGSAVTDLALEFFFELVTEGNNLDEIAERLKGIANPAYLVRNTDRLLRIFRT